MGDFSSVGDLRKIIFGHPEHVQSVIENVGNRKVVIL